MCSDSSDGRTVAVGRLNVGPLPQAETQAEIPLPPSAQGVYLPTDSVGRVAEPDRSEDHALSIDLLARSPSSAAPPVDTDSGRLYSST